MSAAGLPLEESELSTEDAIRRDPRFTDAQRRALLSVVRSYLEANDP